jgi:putative transposase
MKVTHGATPTSFMLRLNWSNLNRSPANLVEHHINQLTAPVKTWLRRMQYQPGLPEGSLAKPRLGLTAASNFHNRRSLRPVS